MIGSSKDREAIASLQEVVRTLSAQLSGAVAEIRELAARHADSVTRANACDGALAALREEVREVKALVEARHAAEAERKPAIEAAIEELSADRGAIATTISAQTGQLDAQNALIAKHAAACDDHIRRCNGALARLERQVESDLTEIRETHAAFASALMRLRTNGTPFTTE